MHGTQRVIVVFGLVLAVMACSPAGQRPDTVAAARANANNDSGLKPWKEVLRDTNALRGFFTLHRGQDGSLHLELPTSLIGVDFGMVVHLSQGLGEAWFAAGVPMSEGRLMRFRRAGQRLLLIHRNPRFTAKAGSPLAHSLTDNVGHSIVAGLPIVSENQKTKSILVDVHGFLTTDYPGVAQALKDHYGAKDKARVELIAERSFVADVASFPKNTEIDAVLTFSAQGLVAKGRGAAVSDPRAITVGLRYSFFALPAQPMRRRVADERVGYIVEPVVDYSRDPSLSAQVDYIRRWRLEKKDHSVAVSEPIKPIVYYIDRSVPHEYRKYVREGVLAWSAAFEQAGYRNAIAVKDAPTGDPAWSAEDIRYSTIRWSTLHHGVWSGFGPTQVDPRTGEILNADILMWSEVVRLYRDIYQGYVEEPTPSAQTAFPGGCTHQHGLVNQLMTDYVMASTSGASPTMEQFIGGRVRHVVMHEVGHALGLMHNFRASSTTPYDKLHDVSYTSRHGISSSIMDYIPYNVALDSAKQGEYFHTVIGDYDRWAILYGYAPIYEQAEDGPLAKTGTIVASAQQEQVGLAKILRRSTDPRLALNNDRDQWLGEFAIDPLTQVWDLGDDPLTFVEHQIEIYQRVFAQLEDSVLEEGDSYWKLRTVFLDLLRRRDRQMRLPIRFVGGLHSRRLRKGGAEKRQPLAPVPAHQQRRALALLMKAYFDDSSLQIPGSLWNRLAPFRGGLLAPVFAPAKEAVEVPILDTFRLAQQRMLTELFAPARLRRIIDNQFRYGPERHKQPPLSLPELFSTVSGTIWSSLAKAKPLPITAYHRGAQRVYVDTLIELLDPRRTDVPGDARALARQELETLHERIKKARARYTRKDETTAHLADVRATIADALANKRVIMNPK